ncbi:MAG TPA: hypothetical protein VGF88_23600 [Acidobacteriaceae bacterium]|jgi:hypothetical protein
MAIELLQPKQEKLRAIEILRSVLVQGQPLTKGKQVRVPEAEAYDLVHNGQAKFITPADVNAPYGGVKK